MKTLHSPSDSNSLGKKLMRLIPAATLIGILGTSPAEAEQTFELNTPAAVSYHLFTTGLITRLQADAASLSGDDWAKINDLREVSRKLRYIYNNFPSWARLEGLVHEKKMIVEIKPTPTGYVIVGCVIQKGDPKKPFGKPFRITTLDNPTLK